MASRSDLVALGPDHAAAVFELASVDFEHAVVVYEPAITAMTQCGRGLRNLGATDEVEGDGRPC